MGPLWDIVLYHRAMAPDGWHDFGVGPGMMWGFWGIGLIFMIVFWGLVIVGLILLIRWLSRATRAGKPPGMEESAMDILKKRYARGEINKEEFEQKKRDIL